jgi:hypothetical protein
VLWTAVGLGLVLFVAANVDLVRKAVSSEPACVEHVKPGDGGAARGLYGAAGPAC